MERNLRAESYEDFVALCRQQGVQAVAVQSVHEVRPILHGSGVTVGPQQYADLVGYIDGLVIKARLPESGKVLEGRLKEAGFRTRLRNVNIG